MKNLAVACVLICILASQANAQNVSHWGVSGGFVPEWKATATGSLKDVTTLILDEELLPVSGGEFRIGIARGRRLSGDWSVSYVRRSIKNGSPITSQTGGGCQGSQSGVNAPFILKCEDFIQELTRNDLAIRGVEFSKFISFHTFAERVQIGINLAGGVGSGQGEFTTREFSTKYTCTYPPGTIPSFGDSDVQCPGGGTLSGETTTQTGSGTEPFTRMLTYSQNIIPMGKVEIAAAFIVAPQVKVRVSGGLNYPGQHVISVTGLYFFGKD